MQTHKRFNDLLCNLFFKYYTNALLLFLTDLQKKTEIMSASELQQFTQSCFSDKDDQKPYDIKQRFAVDLKRILNDTQYMRNDSFNSELVFDNAEIYNFSKHVTITEHGAFWGKHNDQYRPKTESQFEASSPWITFDGFVVDAALGRVFAFINGCEVSNDHKRRTLMLSYLSAMAAGYITNRRRIAIVFRENVYTIMASELLLRASITAWEKYDAHVPMASTVDALFNIIPSIARDALHAFKDRMYLVHSTTLTLHKTKLPITSGYPKLAKKSTGVVVDLPLDFAIKDPKDLERELRQDRMELVEPSFLAAWLGGPFQDHFKRFKEEFPNEHWTRLCAKSALYHHVLDYFTETHPEENVLKRPPITPTLITYEVPSDMYTGAVDNAPKSVAHKFPDDRGNPFSMYK